MMNKTGIIIRREYITRVSKKSFLLLTFLMPFLMVALLFVPLWLAQIKSDKEHRVVIIDATGRYISLFEDTETYRFAGSGESLEDYRKSSGKEVFAILNITGDLLEDPDAATLYSEKQIPGDLSRLVNQTLSRGLENDKLATFDIPNLKEIIADSKVNFNVRTIKWSDDGTERTSSARIASVVGLVSTLIIYMFILIYGSMVMQGVLEEKTNRIVELIVSSVRPFDLMMGKIIALGFVGLTQLFLWGVMTGCLLSAGLFLMGGEVNAPALQQGVVLPAQMEVADGIYQALSAINFGEIGFYFLIYFIGGYLLYASVFAAIGSSVSQQEDTQQFMTPVMILVIFAMYTGMYSMENPDGPLAFWCSLIPFTSPIVMMVRLPFEIPLW
jgi:ABC-2 type transport system permease protein